MIDLVVCSAAEHEYADALTWYAERSVQAAERFDAEFDQALETIASDPERFPQCDNRHHYYLMRHFPYQIQKIRSGWRIRPANTAKLVLKSLGLSAASAGRTLGASSLDPWKMVSNPFGPEFPGDRCCNLYRPQYKVEPVKGEHPHWDKL